MPSVEVWIEGIFSITFNASPGWRGFEGEANGMQNRQQLGSSKGMRVLGGKSEAEARAKPDQPAASTENSCICLSNSGERSCTMSSSMKPNTARSTSVFFKPVDSAMAAN